ncbi:unnamed protein product [Camellia sinensis]
MVNSRKVFDRMSERSLVTWTALVSGYSQNGYSEEALVVFSAMHRIGVKANQFTYGSTLRACTSMMCLDRGNQIQGCIQKSRLVKNLFVQSALVDLHSKCGKLEDACYIFESMPERDVVSWNAMIGGNVVQGFADDALRLFRSMLRAGTIPDSFTLGSIMKAFVGGSSLMKVIQIHGFIIQLGCESHNVLIGSLIDAYAKCGSVRIAYRIYKSMLKKDTMMPLISSMKCVRCIWELIMLYYALSSLWGAILGACNIYGDMSLGEVAARHLFNIEPEKSVDYVVLAGTYAAVGLWDSVWKKRKLMEERSLIKYPGYSLLQSINKRVPLWQPKVKMLH